MSRAPVPAASLRELADRRERSRRLRERAQATALRWIRVIRPVTWALGAAATVCLLVGLNWGWTELVVLALIIACVFLLSLPFLLGGTAYKIDLELQRTRVVAGERAFGTLVIANPTARSLPATRVVLPVGPGRGAFDVPRLAAGDERDEIFSIPTDRRGVIPVGPTSVLRGDPLGLFERISSRGDVVDLYVHPRTVALQGLSVGGLRDLEGLPTTEISSDDVSFHALREYQPGDDLRHVHWRSTARTGSVMVRQYEQTRRSTYLVGLSTSSGDYASDDEFELAVSIVASVGLHALGESADHSVLVPGKKLASTSPHRLLDELSAVTAVRGPGAGVEAVSVGMAAHPSALALAIIVTGSGADPAAVRSACARLPQGTRTLVFVASVGAQVSMRRFGEAESITIGDLDELPAAIRRVLS